MLDRVKDTKTGKEQEKRILNAYRRLVETGSVSRDLPSISDRQLLELGVWKHNYNPKTINNQERMRVVGILDNTAGAFRTHENMTYSSDRKISNAMFATAIEQTSKYVQGQDTNNDAVNYSLLLLRETHAGLKEDELRGDKKLTENEELVLSFLERLKAIGIVKDPLLPGEQAVAGALYTMQKFRQTQQNVLDYQNSSEKASPMDQNSQDSGIRSDTFLPPHRTAEMSAFHTSSLSPDNYDEKAKLGKKLDNFRSKISYGNIHILSDAINDLKQLITTQNRNINKNNEYINNLNSLLKEMYTLASIVNNRDSFGVWNDEHIKQIKKVKEDLSIITNSRYKINKLKDYLNEN